MKNFTTTTIDSTKDSSGGRCTTIFETIGLRIRITRWNDHSSMQISLDGKEPGTPNICFFLEEFEVQTLVDAITHNFNTPINL